MNRSRMNNDNRVDALTNRQQLLDSIKIILTASFFSTFQIKQKKRKWSAKGLVVVSLLMSWSDTSCLKDRFSFAHNWAINLSVGFTYQGWVKAAKRWSPQLFCLIDQWWRDILPSICGIWWEIEGWIPVGADGSKFNLPRTAANERAFGVSGKNNSGPQMYLCALLHLATGLPWSWRIGKGKVSERELLRRMLDVLPTNGLLVADAGFVGFALWKCLNQNGNSFLIRAGANVRLLKGLGYKVKYKGEFVYLWPVKCRKKSAPLILRLIEIKDGDKRMCLLTNVLDSNKLTDEQAVKFYQWRWGIELWFRSIKQVLNKRKLRSKAPAQVVLELRWALVAVGLLGLLGVKAQIEAGGDPKQLSFAEVLRVVRGAALRPQQIISGDQLVRLLAKAVKDNYVRYSSKKARNWPHKKKESPPGFPKISTANKAQKKQAVEIMNKGLPE